MSHCQRISDSTFVTQWLILIIFSLGHFVNCWNSWHALVSWYVFSFSACFFNTFSSSNRKAAAFYIYCFRIGGKLFSVLIRATILVQNMLPVENQHDFKPKSLKCAHLFWFWIHKSFFIHLLIGSIRSLNRGYFFCTADNILAQICFSFSKMFFFVFLNNNLVWYRLRLHTWDAVRNVQLNYNIICIGCTEEVEKASYLLLVLYIY